MEVSKYSVRWNPDSRWNYGHWTVTRYSSGCSSSSHYNYLSDALKHPLWIKELYPENVELTFPSKEAKERARSYYGSILEDMFNVTEGKFIGC